MKHEDGIPLQTWFNENMPDPTKLAWANSARAQVRFVRDDLHGLFITSHNDRAEQPIRVVGTHSSKSVKLPVYSIKVPDYIEVRLRGNFYNWITTVRAPEGHHTGYITSHILSRYEREHAVARPYAEGFDPDWVLPSYAHGSERGFTIDTPYNHYHLFTWLFELTESIGLHVNWSN